MKRIIKIMKYCMFEFLPKLKYKYLSDCKRVYGKINSIQPILLSGKGKISIGRNVNIGVKRSPFFYDNYSYIEARTINSSIKIGSDVSINNNLSIISEKSIIIEDNCLIGTNCEILDSDFHDLDPNFRLKGKVKSSPIHIRKNVFIGNNVKILKGVEIGENSVIANSSIVTRSLPSNSVCGGAPAKFIKKLGKNKNENLITGRV